MFRWRSATFDARHGTLATKDMDSALDPKRRLAVFRATVTGGLVFVVLTGIAFAIYPGGTRLDPTAERYRFAENFFSDLGRTRDFEGNGNLLTAGLFAAGLLTVGSTTALFFVSLPGLFGSDRATRATSLVMSALGLLAGAGFIGVALTPWNLVPRAHDVCVNVGFRSLLLACLAATVNVYRSSEFPNRYGHLLVAVSLVLLSYILLLEFGPSMDTPRGLLVQAGGQKIVAYSLILGMTTLAFGAMRVQRARQSGAGDVSPPDSNLDNGTQK